MQMHPRGGGGRLTPLEGIPRCWTLVSALPLRSVKSTCLFAFSYDLGSGHGLAHFDPHLIPENGQEQLVSVSPLQPSAYFMATLQVTLIGDVAWLSMGHPGPLLPLQMLLQPLKMAEIRDGSESTINIPSFSKPQKVVINTAALLKVSHPAIFAET